MKPGGRIPKIQSLPNPKANNTTRPYKVDARMKRQIIDNAKNSGLDKQCESYPAEDIDDIYWIDFSRGGFGSYLGRTVFRGYPDDYFKGSPEKKYMAILKIREALSHTEIAGECAIPDGETAESIFAKGEAKPKEEPKFEIPKSPAEEAASEPASQPQVGGIKPKGGEAPEKTEETPASQPAKEEKEEESSETKPLSKWGLALSVAPFTSITYSNVTGNKDLPMSNPDINKADIFGGIAISSQLRLRVQPRLSVIGGIDYSYNGNIFSSREVASTTIDDVSYHNVAFLGGAEYMLHQKGKFSVSLGGKAGVGVTLIENGDFGLLGMHDSATLVTIPIRTAATLRYGYFFLQGALGASLVIPKKVDSKFAEDIPQDTQLKGKLGGCVDAGLKLFMGVEFPIGK